MKVGLTGKVWMAMAIMIGGFLLIIGLAWAKSFAISKRLDAVKAGYFPAISSGTEAQARLKQFLGRYHRAVILGDSSLFDDPAQKLDRAVMQQSLELIAKDSGVDIEHRDSASKLLIAIDAFTKTVEPKYRRLSEGEEPVGDLAPEQMAKYALQQEELKKIALTLKEGLGDRFEEELSLVNDELRLQQQVNIVLFLIVTALSVGAALYVISKYVKKPIQLTVKAANNIAGGNFSQRLQPTGDDEIGDLGRSFNKMAENLEGTLIGLQEEVLERTRAQEALRTNEENLRITLDSIGEAVIATDRAGSITRFNPEAANVTGWSRDEVLGRSIDDVLNLLDPSGKYPINDPLDRILKEGGSHGVERMTLISKSGVRKQVAETGAPILNSQNEAVGVVLVFRDITEQLMRDEQLNQTRKMDSVGQLAGGIAHDFNNMLGAIMGAGEYMKDKIGNDKSLEQMVELIITASEQASGLTQKLLAFSRKGKVHPVELNMHELIDEVIGLLERSIDKRITLECNKNADIAVVIGDRSQLLNAIINLGINSRDAMPNGGKITFTTETVELTQSQCEESPFELGPGLYLKLTAEDNGTGIPMSIQSKVFDPFFTTKDVGKGTGLGLAAVYGCVKEHNGALNLKSTEGVGTAIEILLPAVESSTLNQTALTQPLRKGVGCILIVDDESVMRKSISLMLEQLGYAYLTAVDGEDATRIFKASHKAVDLVILDMIMPKMNGVDCLSALRKIDPSVKVVIATGFADPGSLQAVQKQGVSAIINKPFRIGELGDVLGDILVEEKEGVDT